RARPVARPPPPPQSVSSLIAAGLDPLGAAEVRLSGQGLRDMTRLAGSDPDLWTGILASNAGPVSAALAALIERLAQVRDGLRGLAGGTTAVRDALRGG